MFNSIFIESKIIDSPRVQKILARFENIPTYPISKIEDFWGRVKKPYLQKRDNLNLYLGHKKGSLVKAAPDAYGAKGLEHFYFIHAYNCIYECQYCYLQGYFNSPDIVLFLNHEEILTQMQEVINHRPQGSWFHAGEFSDSLALSHITGELPLYFDFFKLNPKHFLELRTKSVNTKELEILSPLANVFISFSLSPSTMAKDIDLKTPSTKARIQAMKKLQQLGHTIAIHLDPIYYLPEFSELYDELFSELKQNLNLDLIAYFSLGVVRFTKVVYQEFQRNYPDSILHNQSMQKSFDGKIRYSKPERHWMMNTIKEKLLNLNIEPEKIYLCMEND